MIRSTILLFSKRNYMANIWHLQRTISSLQSVCTFTTQKSSGRKLLKKYQKIKNRLAQGKETESSLIKENVITQTNNSLQSAENFKNDKIVQLQNLQNYKVRCEGCNTILQSKDKTKYGYITQKILNQTIQQNSEKLNKSYSQKIKSKDSKVLDIMHEVEKQLGVKMLNENSNKIENLNNIEVLMKLQEKIDKYEQSQQILNRQKKQRKQVLCFRCFSLKFHNRLPQQYDNNQDFTQDSTQFILNKVIHRHKGTEIQYFYMIDTLDILGTFQQQLFKRLVQQNLQITLVVNKVDIINKDYLNQTAIHAAVKLRLNQFMKRIYVKPDQLNQKLSRIKIFYISCNSKDGFKKLRQYIENSNKNIQLIGYPNTGKTSLLNILSRTSKSISKVPGTTIKITQHQYKDNKKRKIFDMPGLFSKNLLYNLIQKPSIKSMFTWHKKIAPGLLTNQAFIYGGKIQIPDTRIIVFGNGGACSSSNKWFLDNYQQFWKGLPQPNQLKIKKHQILIQFNNGKTEDLQIAGYGFIGFRLCIPNMKKATRKLTLYLPQQVSFGFRPSILNSNDGAFHNKSAFSKRFMLQRLSIDKKHGASSKQQQLKKDEQVHQQPKSNINRNYNQESTNFKQQVVSEKD